MSIEMDCESVEANLERNVPRSHPKSPTAPNSASVACGLLRFSLNLLKVRAGVAQKMQNSGSSEREENVIWHFEGFAPSVDSGSLPQAGQVPSARVSIFLKQWGHSMIIAKLLHRYSRLHHKFPFSVALVFADVSSLSIEPIG